MVNQANVANNVVQNDQIVAVAAQVTQAIIKSDGPNVVNNLNTVIGAWAASRPSNLDAIMQNVLANNQGFKGVSACHSDCGGQ